MRVCRFFVCIALVFAVFRNGGFGIGDGGRLLSGLRGGLRFAGFDLPVQGFGKPLVDEEGHNAYERKAQDVKGQHRRRQVDQVEIFSCDAVIQRLAEDVDQGVKVSAEVKLNVEGNGNEPVEYDCAEGGSQRTDK